MERAHGIDVSHHHRVRDWDAVVKHGVTIFGAKATNGRGVDTAFLAHRDGARLHPFELVVYYHFPTPRSPAADQAEHFLATVGRLMPNERLCLDVEPDPLSDGWCPNLEFVDTFVRRIALPDRRPLVYTSSRVWKENVGGRSWGAAVLSDLWVPRYDDDEEVVGPEPKLPIDSEGYAVWPRWTIWQDSRGYTCPGVDGPCDHNVFRGDLEELRAYARLAGTVTAPPGA